MTCRLRRLARRLLPYRHRKYAQGGVVAPLDLRTGGHVLLIHDGYVLCAPDAHIDPKLLELINRHPKDGAR